MCVSAFVCVCVSVVVRSLRHEWVPSSVCCRLWQPVCVWVCVQGYTFTRTAEGCLTFGSGFKQRDTPPVHPLIQPAVEGFPLQTKWKIPRQKAPPSDFFVWVFNLSSFLLPPTYSPRRFCLWLFCFYPQFFFVGAHAETLLNQMKAGMCGLRCQNRNFLPAREASVCWFYKEVRFIGEWSDAEAGGGAAFTLSYGSINKNKEAYNGSFTARCLEQK